MVGIEMLQVWS